MANACLNFTTSDYGYREGYRRAGRLLAKYVCNECKHQDLLVYPIVHNYRHHLELMLKHLIGVRLIFEQSGDYTRSKEAYPEIPQPRSTMASLEAYSVYRWASGRVEP